MKAGNSELTRVAMWSGPRNISTAMLRAFENRPDTVVVDEPFYGYYLHQTGLDHPGATQIIAAMDCDWRSVAARLAAGLPAGQHSRSCCVYYQKHMTHHMLPAIDLEFTDRLLNCFLVRDPGAMIASYARVRPEFALEELGLERQWQIFQHCAERAGTAPAVLDASRILARPEACLAALCEHIGVPFSDRMLRWPAGSRSSDGVWAPHWYAAVEQSTGFAAPSLDPVTIPDRYLPMVARARQWYDRLLQYHLAVPA